MWTTAYFLLLLCQWKQNYTMWNHDACWVLSNSKTVMSTVLDPQVHSDKVLTTHFLMKTHVLQHCSSEENTESSKATMGYYDTLYILPLSWSKLPCSPSCCSHSPQDSELALENVCPNVKIFWGPLHPGCERQPDNRKLIHSQTHLKLLMTSFKDTSECLF